MKKDTEFSSNSAFVLNQYGKEKEYWLNKLSGELVKSVFPYDHTDRAGEPASPAEVKIVFPDELSKNLIKLGTGKDHRLHIVLLAAVSVLLKRYTGSSDITLGIPIYKQGKQGRFINTAVALRQYLPRTEDITFKELLLQTRQTLMEAIEHQNYPLDILVYQLDLSLNEDEFPLFDIMVLLENIHDKKYIRHLNCSIVFSFLRSGETIEGRVEYNPHRYEKSTVERIVRHFSHLLSAVLGGVDRPLNAAEILTLEEKRFLLYELNDTGADYPKDKNLSRLFADQVNERSDSIAVIDLWSGSGRLLHYVTYGELSRDSNRLAHRLKEKEVKPDTIVALLVQQPLHLITGILATLTAGGAYMPIDPGYPRERMQLMLKDSNAVVLLKTRDLEAPVSGGDSLEVLDIDGLNFQGESIIPDNPANLEPGSLAYVLYTSGSTGGPKGVMVSSRNVARLVKNTNYMEFSENTRLLQNGSPVFDALTFELWGTLLNGGQLILAEKEFILDAKKLGNALKRYRINAMLLTPVFFNQLVQQDSGMFGQLDWLLVGGDVLSPSHINRARQKNRRLKVVNAYGPTENTVISTSYLIDRDFETGIPIGRPINNSTVYIFGTAHGLQPVGVVGELYVGGDGVARGYMNNPELTAEKFERTVISLPGKFSRAVDNRCQIIHDRLYGTGDLARWLPEGMIEFLSRRDYQVKIRGHRIELGEIENRLLKHTDIKDTTVLLTGGKDQPSLCAYFVADREMTGSELKDYLSEGLPDYMVPTYFVQLEKLPCTPTGKIDRKALPDPKTMLTEKKTHQPPGNETEAVVRQTWAEVLELDPEKISIEDDFFELGGNSINILKVQNQLRKHFNCDISMSTMFLHPTIKALAADIIKNSSGKKLESVVKLNKGKNKKNIFIFHPLHGMIYPYKELAKLLEDRFNIYGVQAKGLTGDTPLPGNKEEMLTGYLKEIREVQAKGPYIFSGYCIGNVLAYLAAMEMEDRGEAVETLILFDIGTLSPEKVSWFYRWRLYLEHILFYYHINRKETPPGYSDEAKPEQKELMARVKANNQSVFHSFRYKRIIHSPIIHIRAQENLSMLLFQKAWYKLSKGRVKLFKSTGNHHNMFTYPHVKKLAKIIKENI
ncbi:MAG: amino acid adenylation domain-containing protein [Candidatus Aminicenantes bacterium]|jgi:amino acid adenylation domain-containing protein